MLVFCVNTPKRASPSDASVVEACAARSEKALTSLEKSTNRSAFVLAMEGRMAKGSSGKGSGGKASGGSYRSAVTGRNVTPRYGQSHTSTTVRETNKPSGGGKKGK
jgi:hypothetical protein